jgi:hypothetical protein
MFKKVFYIVAALNNTVNVDHRYTSAGWMIQGLMTFFKCWMEDAGFEVFLRVLAGGCRF